ncbi:MAG: alpha/beta fold hydrolase [Pseudomonadota bacterium]
MIHFQAFGPRNSLIPIILVHGLYGSGRNFGSMAKKLAKTRTVLVPDLRNHGQSPWHESHSYEDLAEDLAELCTTLDSPADIMGHSMGGKAAMALALTAPHHVNRLLVADIAPVAYAHSQLEYIHAMKAMDLSAIEKRTDAQLEVSDPMIRSFLLQNLDVAERRWRLNLDVLERDMPKILDFPKRDTSFDGDTLFLHGGRSDYVLPEHRPEIRRLFPKARFAKLPQAGHWIHADEPQKFQASLEAFFAL